MMQFKAICAQLRDLYLAYPGISQAASDAPRNLHALRINEGLLAILLAGGVAAQPAAWAIDAAILYVGAYSLERSPLTARVSMASPATGTDRRAATDAARKSFPHTVAHLREIVAGNGHERFDFTLNLLLRD